MSSRMRECYFISFYHMTEYLTYLLLLLYDYYYFVLAIVLFFIISYD